MIFFVTGEEAHFVLWAGNFSFEKFLSFIRYYFNGPVLDNCLTWAINFVLPSPSGFTLHKNGSYESHWIFLSPSGENSPQTKKTLILPCQCVWMARARPFVPGPRPTGVLNLRPPQLSRSPLTAPMQDEEGVLRWPCTTPARLRALLLLPLPRREDTVCSCFINLFCTSQMMLWC